MNYTIINRLRWLTLSSYERYCLLDLVDFVVVKDMGYKARYEFMSTNYYADRKKLPVFRTLGQVMKYIHTGENPYHGSRSHR